MQDRLRATVLLLVVAVLGGAWIVQSRVAVEDNGGIGTGTEAPRPGHLAPSFSLPTLTGEMMEPAGWQGKPVVINFWATWCPPCRAEIPDLQAASRKYNGQAVVVGVNQGEPAGVVNPFSAQLGITYPVLLDLDNRVSQDYAVSALPTTFFIDKNGMVREVFTGILNQAILEDRIEALLAE